VARRLATENWDAFEGPGGKPLLNLIQAPHPWSHVRLWLFDLASELIVAEKRRERTRHPRPRRVWITSDGGPSFLISWRLGLRVTLRSAASSGTGSRLRRGVPSSSRLRCQIVVALEPFARLFFQTAEDDPGKPRRDLRIEFPWRRRGLLEHSRQHLDRVLSFKRRFDREQIK